MPANIDYMVENREMLKMINILVEEWFDENEVPRKYRMSIPMFLMYEKRRGSEKVLFHIGAINNQVGIGYC